jgi:hypothetical protein
MKIIDIDKGRLEKVYLIYYQYISLPCYYASNTEWVFNHRAASLFGTEEEAKYNIERLTEYESKTLQALGICPQELRVESRYMVVSNCLIL